MAEDNTTPGTLSGDDEQVTFNIKSSSDAKHTVTVPLTTTVAELKQKLSTPDYANIPSERQRLIYSGRVLKDPDTIGSCKIKAGNTVHLVKGADSNQRQNPANQGGAASVPLGAGQRASNVPTNLAAGTAASDPLAHLTGARYAGFHGLPGADMFGADGGMGAPPNPDQMMRMMEDPNFLQQMNEAMENPAVMNMLRNNPMIRDNPMAQAIFDNPELRRMMLSPEMLRMQMQMQRSTAGGSGGASAFPMPGQTDTTPTTDNAAPSDDTSTQTNTGAAAGANTANPFAALFGGGNTAAAQNPFGSLLGNQPAAGGQQNPLQAMSQQLMQNPQLMQNMMRMMGGGAGGAGGAPGGAPGGFDFGNLFGNAEPPAPADNRPPEERYESQLRQLNDMGFFDFDRNVQALRRSGGSVQGAIEYLFSAP